MWCLLLWTPLDSTSFTACWLSSAISFEQVTLAYQLASSPPSWNVFISIDFKLLEDKDLTHGVLVVACFDSLWVYTMVSYVFQAFN
jgi:hypothetical protein